MVLFCCPITPFACSLSFFFFFNKFIYFIYSFLAALGLRCCARAFSSCSERGLLFVRCVVFSLRWLLLLRSWALGARASVVVARGLSSCGSRALERRLSSCGTRDLLLRGMWDLPGPGLEPVSPALIGRWILNHCAMREVPLQPFLTRVLREK